MDIELTTEDIKTEEYQEQSQNVLKEVKSHKCDSCGKNFADAKNLKEWIDFTKRNQKKNVFK